MVTMLTALKNAHAFDVFVENASKEGAVCNVWVPHASKDGGRIFKACREKNGALGLHCTDCTKARVTC